MEKEECWSTFLESGKVTDYLNYRQAVTETAVGRHQGDPQQKGHIKSGEDSDDRVKQNAGFY